MAKRHRLLERQVKRSGINFCSEKNGEYFLDTIDKSYVQFERERKILEESAKRMLGKISQSNEDLRAIIDALDGFNYHVSHDLKTSLINSVSLGKMVKKYAEVQNFEKINEITDKLVVNSSNGLKLVEKYLQISKFDSALVAESIIEVCIKEVVEKIIVDLQLEGVFELCYGQIDFETIEAKEVGLYSLFQNLITNAVKYKKPDTDLIIEISLIRKDGEKAIHFKDNGIGIDVKRYKDKIFQPFVRIKNQLNKEGTGVGLFIVKKVVLENKGEISIKSELGVGTEFILTF